MVLAIAAGVGSASVLRHKPFAFFWCARVLSSFAYQMNAVAIGWLVYALTGSALDLGLVGLAQFLPVLLLTLVAGHVADRYDRRRIVQACQAVECGAAAILAAGAAAGWLGVHGIFGIVAVIGAARAFEAPTLSALMPGLVERAQLPQASAFAASANQTATILGPAAGGLLYALGAPAPFACVAGLYALAVLAMACIRMDRPVVAREPVSLRSVFLGLAFIRGNPAILGAISLDLFAVLLGGATALLPIFAADILHTGAWGLGVLRAAPAVGALTMSVLLAHRPMRKRAGRRMFGAVIVFGVATVVFALSRSLPLSLAALCVLGAADVVSVVVRYSLVQANTPDAMRGRVSAVNMLFIGTSNQLGEFESGTTAALFGTVPAVLIGGVGTIAVALLWMRLFPALRGRRPALATALAHAWIALQLPSPGAHIGIMNRRTLLAGLALSPLMALHAQAAPALSAQDEADIARVQAYLNTITTLKARFQQIAPDGSISGGVAWIDRPGRMRFEYDPPAPFLLVAGHGLLVFNDSKLQQTSNIPIGRTPLGLLLSDNLKLSGDVTVIGVQRYPGQLQITLQRTATPGDGHVDPDLRRQSAGAAILDGGGCAAAGDADQPVRRPAGRPF